MELESAGILILLVLIRLLINYGNDIRLLGFFLQIVMPTLGWRWLLAFSAVPSAVLLIFYRTAPESPRYLCRRGRTDEAVEILERMAKLNQAELPPGILVSDPEVAKITDLPSEDARLLSPNKDENGTLDSLDSNLQKGTSVFTLLSPQLLRSTLLLWVVFIGNAFAYYGLVLLTTELSNKNNTCTPTHTQSVSAKSADVNYKNVFITSFAGITFVLQTKNHPVTHCKGTN